MASQVASTPDHLFTLRNNFYLGAYQAAINCADSLPPLSPEESIEKESLVFRSYIALGSYPLVINEIDESAATALQAVKLLAMYLSSPESKESVISSLKEWLADPAIGNNATLKLIAGTIFMHEQDYNEALKHTNSGGSMDFHALNIQIFIKMHRVDYAEKQLRIMQQIDGDHALTQLANAWFDTAVLSGDVSLNSGDDNNCCRNWREKYAKLEEKRNALRQAVKLLELQLDKVQAECASHKNARSLECARAELERKEKEKLTKVQTELEENICSLKLEVSLLGCADSNLEEKVKLLEAKITKGEAEIKHLKELLKKEKSRADLERKNVLSEKKRSAEALKALEAGKSKADKERQISTEGRKKFEQSQLEVEKLKKEVEGFRSRLVIETVKYEETSKKHELERQKTMKEKKRADKEKDRADEQRRLADESNRKLIEENAHVVELCEELEAGKQKITKLQEEKNKLLAYLNRSLLEEKDQADKFSNDVRILKLPEHLNKLPLATGMTKALGNSSARQDNGVSENFPSVLFGEAIGNLNCQKEKASIISEYDLEIMKESGKLAVAHKSRKRVLEEFKVGNLSKDLAGKRQRIESFQHHEQVFQKPANTHATKSSRSKKVENMKLKLFKEQLKLEKLKTKHAKEVLEFEKCRNSILSQEIRQMRFDFGQYSRPLDMLDSFISPDSGGVSKVGKNVRKYMDALKNNHRGSESFHPCSLADTELFQPSGRGSSFDFASGTDSQLEFSRGGSLGKKLQSSAINSAVASFSDRGFLGSQDKACSPAAIAKMVDDEKIETQCHGKVAWPAENIAHSSYQEGDPRVETLEQKRIKSVELADFRDAVCVNANKEHRYGLDNNMECREEFSDGFCSDLEGVVNLIGADFNYMRLLELDNLTDENRYNLATGRLLSPLHDSDLDVIEANAVVANVSQRIGPPENDNHFVLSTVNVVENRAIDSKLGCAPSGTEIFVSSFEKQYGYALDTPPEFCVISSDVKDEESISNIFKATRSCMVQASSPSQTGRTVPKVSIISSMEDKLQGKEKICVFFTVLLLKLSHAWPGSAGRVLNRAMLNCVDSFDEMLITVMADDKMRSLFEEECQIDYLLHIIEDFLVDGRVALFPNTCSRPIVTSTRDLGIALNGNDGLFPSKTTSTNLVVSGGVILASICAATNNIGFICEASYRIFQVYRSDISLLLTILHAFSYICGKHYFASPIYGTLMVVVKSLVTYAEDSFMSESSGSCPMLLDGSDVGSSSCIRCPFRAEAVSVDEITFLLLEKVAKTISAVQYDEAGPFCLLKYGRPHFEDIDRNNACAGSFPAVGLSDIDLDIWCPISQCGMSAVPLEKKLDDYLNNNIELLSLLEIVANVVGWEFAQNKIIPSLLSIFKSCISIPVAAGIMVLIGRLGRIGAVAHGYDDVRVDTLRSELCDVVRRVGASDPSFIVQTAILNALLSLLPNEFVNIVEDGGDNLTSVSQSQSLAASSIRKWYSSLSRERQVLAHSVLLSTTPDK